MQSNNFIIHIFQYLLNDDSFDMAVELLEAILSNRADIFCVADVPNIYEIILNKKLFIKKPNESVFIPKGTIHRIQNFNKKPVKIMEVQLGSILRETDIVRYKDIYGRIS